MSRLRALLAVSFRAKVLAPVLTLLALLLAATVWVVYQRASEQIRSDAAASLASADAGIRILLKDRRDNLLLRFHELPKQPYYRSAFAAHDAPLLREPLNTLLAQQDVDIVLFSSNRLVASAARDRLVPVAAFEAGCAPAIKLALQRIEVAASIQVEDRLYDVVCLPMLDANDNLLGALTVGSEFNADLAEKLSSLTHCQIVMLASNQLVASRSFAPESRSHLSALFQSLVAAPVSTGGAPVLQQVRLGDEHYYCAAGRLDSLSGDQTLGYLLLRSYEQPWRALQTTQLLLLGVGGLALLVGACTVSLVVGRITRPLRELRDSAEAVGRGDFSRRLDVEYVDECGELARVFNRMTENLKNSRDQLEMTVETLKTTQAQLIQSEKLSGIGEFIAGVAHELNNPLTSVMGFSELLRQAEVDPKYKRYMEMIHKSALRCQKIVQALLSFARRRAPERKPVCVNNLIEAAVEILQYQLRTSNIEVITRLDPHLPQVIMDPHQIQQVFVNILNNSRQALETHQPKGWIKVTTLTQGDSVRVIIQDNGPGIPQSHLSKIFDPFFTTKEIGQGTGLGLSLCYGIIKEHGGTITPCSKPGEGAVFIIELPMTHEAGETPVEKHAVEAEPANPREGEGRKVLVIDDEEPILHMVREALAPRGYEVDVAPDGESGLKKLDQQRYDVMLCDWKMPGLNGQQVYERLRAKNPAMSERVIFITGDLISEKTRKFLEEQNKVCIPKPFTLAEFRTAIKKILATTQPRSKKTAGP